MSVRCALGVPCPCLPSILKTNTNATCPRPTKKNCLGPPPVNTTSQFCQWVCLTFCNACADGECKRPPTPALAPAGTGLP